MSISSLVIEVADDASGRDALAALAADARFTLGPAAGARHAVVVDTASIADDTDAYLWLQSLAGVRFITLVRAYLDDEAPPAGAAAELL